MGIIYVLGYGLVRWRKFIVMKEYDAKEERLMVREVGPGWDVRDDGRGILKNRLDPMVFSWFHPMCFIENAIRGSKKPTS